MQKDTNDFDIRELRSNNDDNPLLRFDAMMAGVKNGGLRSVGGIHLLVSYIVATLSGRVKAETITSAMEQGQLANYFEVADAISKMLSSGVIKENDDGTLSLGNTGGAEIELIEKDLPLTVREQSIKLCQTIIAKEKFRRETKVEITETEQGFDVLLCVSDVNTDFMRLNLFAATREQAEMIKEKFISDPVAVYETVIGSIFANE
ncbi:MAG: DUF4364 family protein [Ruminococcaceae bacterium]|nr:DUF4364 family protein [Oscillospiraceae bacterium]